MQGQMIQNPTERIGEDKKVKIHKLKTDKDRGRAGKGRRWEVWSTTCHVRKTKWWWQIFERSTRAAIWGHHFKSLLCMQVSKGWKICHHLISTCPRATCWTRSCSSWCSRIGATPSCECAERAEQQSEASQKLPPKWSLTWRDLLCDFSRIVLKAA